MVLKVERVIREVKCQMAKIVALNLDGPLSSLPSLVGYRKC